jgi:molybdopterin-guanine dinucleotide biosynthesis protein A
VDQSVQTRDEATLAVLAGGEGRRMGQPKGSLRINGNAILDDLLDRLDWHGPTLLVTVPGREKPTSNFRFACEVVDTVSGQGPLRGVLTALEHLKTGLLVVVPVDMPGVTQLQLDWLIQAFEARTNLLGIMTSRRADEESIVEPFPSAYRIDAKSPIESRLAIGKRSMHGLLDDPRFGLLPAPAQWSEQETWVNLNTPADVRNYEDVLRRAAAGDGST